VTEARRVVVTGLGAVTPLGATLAATRGALERGASYESTFDARGFASARSASVAPFDERRFFRAPKALKLCDRRTRLAVAAAAMAFDDGGPARVDADRTGVVVGTSGSDLGAEELSRALGTDEPERAATDVPFFAERILSGLSPLWLLVHLPNMVSAHVAIQLEARGPNTTVMTGWAAGLQAVHEGAEQVREGAADVVLAGGADSALHPFAFAGLEQAGLLQRGLVPGEGAAMFRLEERSAALARGARIHGEIASGASGVRFSKGPLAFEADDLAARAGHLLAALAPLRLALTLLGRAGTEAFEIAAEGPCGEWASVTALAAGARAFEPALFEASA